MRRRPGCPLLCGTMAVSLQYVRVAVDTKAEALLQLLLKEWQMERPKLLLSVHGASENFALAPKVLQAFSKGLMAAALSSGAWILSEGITTGTSPPPQPTATNHPGCCCPLTKKLASQRRCEDTI